MAATQKEVQREMQKEMQEVQMGNMIRGQERMRRQMIAQQMAITRENLWWMGGFGALLAVGATAYTIKHKSFPAPAAIPLIGYGTVVAYQYDFAYGGKAERINRYTNEIISDPSYWFNPILPDKVPSVLKHESAVKSETKK